jgi:hypothetical protein
MPGRDNSVPAFFMSFRKLPAQLHPTANTLNYKALSKAKKTPEKTEPIPGRYRLGLGQ